MTVQYMKSAEDLSAISSRANEELLTVKINEFYDRYPDIPSILETAARNGSYSATIHMSKEYITIAKRIFRSYGYVVEEAPTERPLQIVPITIKWISHEKYTR